MSDIVPFEPVNMPVGVLTAALQELTPRDLRDPDPDLAVEEWLAFASELGVDCIELSAALHPSVADVPPEALLDPVANTLDLRAPFDAARAARVHAAVEASGVTIADVAYFDDMLHEDAAIRAKKLKLILRDFEPSPTPVSFVYRAGRSMPQKLRAFIDFVTPRMKSRLVFDP